MAVKASAVQPTNVQVVAPATLNAGFTFDAVYEGSTFTVTVPEGGVVEGQRFTVPFTPSATAAVATAVALNPPTGWRSGGEAGIPTGMWRDSFLDCCRFGCCHPSFCCAFCKPFFVAQLLTRMKMTWLGQRTHLGDGTQTDQRWKSTFLNIFLVLAIYGVLQSFLTPKVSINLDATNIDDAIVVPESDGLMGSLSSGLNGLLGFYILYLVVQLRATMRHVYSIPEENCLCLYGGSDPSDGICGADNSYYCTSGVPVGWDDVVCSVCCPLCVTCQMARHTVDYEYRRAECCSTVGASKYVDDEAYAKIASGVGEGTALIV